MIEYALLVYKWIFLREVNELPNIKSAKKRVLVTATKNTRNVSERSALKTSIKKAKVAVASNDTNSNEIVRTASVDLDKAASKGLIHKNTAARKKSRLAKSMNKANA